MAFPLLNPSLNERYFSTSALDLFLTCIYPAISAEAEFGDTGWHHLRGIRLNTPRLQLKLSWNSFSGPFALQIFLLAVQEDYSHFKMRLVFFPCYLYKELLFRVAWIHHFLKYILSSRIRIGEKKDTNVTEIFYFKVLYKPGLVDKFMSLSFRRLR